MRALGEINMKRFGLLLLICSPLVNGCVIWHGNTLASNQAPQTLTLRTSGAGRLPGICGFYPGKATQTDAVIKLHGVKDRYLENEFEILGSSGSVWFGTEDQKGYIEVNRKSKTVRIKVYIKGKRFDLNGYHHYKLGDT